jgi:hypothetical protein
VERAPGRRYNGRVFTNESIMQQKAFDLHFQRQLLRIRRDMRRAFSWGQDDGVYFDPRMLCGPFRHSDPSNTLDSLSILRSHQEYPTRDQRLGNWGTV